MAATWIYQGGLSGRLIDIDQANRQTLTFQLDINQAEWAEWSVLPGIGETLAKRIVDARRQRGPFQHHEDLLRVPGIGPRILERIRPYLLPVVNVEETESGRVGEGGSARRVSPSPPLPLSHSPPPNGEVRVI